MAGEPGPPGPGREAEEPGEWLRGRDKLGWNFELHRIRSLCEELGRPQERFGSIHVVGSNGKSSVAQMTAALLAEHGLATGTYLSPHLRSWAERIRIGGAEIGPAEFSAAIEQVAEAVASVERELGPQDRVTQFEAATAAAFLAFADAGVDVAVVEAGLGGRLDATNVIPSRVTALTSVALEHTEYLGETEEEIATEKLAVLREGTTLVTGPLSEPVMALARATAAERGASFVEVPEAAEGAPAAVLGAYQRRNFAVAIAAAAAYLEDTPNRESIERAGATASRLPARLEWIDGDPPLILDAAHNAAGVEAVVESLPELTGGRPVVAVLAALAEKPATDVCAPLARACEAIICSEIPPSALEGVGRPGARSHPAGELARACVDAGGEAEAVADPSAALERARELARDRGGIVLVLGSFYLLSTLRG